VNILCAATIKRATSGGLELDNCSLVPADLALVGVGVEPSAELARQLGLQVDQGVRVTQSGATSLDGIYAAGDVAEQWSRCHDRWMRVENWANAQNQAIATAKTMAGAQSLYDAPPWFWSDQYDANIQIVGHPGGGCEIIRGDAVNGPFTSISLCDGEVIGGVTVNSARDMAVLRRLVSSHKAVRKADLENPAFELKRALA
jgi:NADPH-dependent 2,4-dienoyl-CoA reductase/sulfur reductase-like enzyme